MKFEKRKTYKLPRLQWGLLPATAASESFLSTLPVLISNNVQNPLTIVPKLTKISTDPRLSLTVSSKFEGYVEETEDIFNKYTIFRNSSFIQFFEKSSIDVPKCFKSTNSLRRPTFELFFLRFVKHVR